MAYAFVTLEEMAKMIKEENETHEEKIQIMEDLQQVILAGDTLFHEKETDKWFRVLKGKSIPLHLQSEILGR